MEAGGASIGEERRVGWPLSSAARQVQANKTEIQRFGARLAPTRSTGDTWRYCEKPLWPLARPQWRASEPVTALLASRARKRAIARFVLGPQHSAAALIQRPPKLLCSLLLQVPIKVGGRRRDWSFSTNRAQTRVPPSPRLASLQMLAQGELQRLRAEIVICHSSYTIKLSFALPWLQVH